MERFVDREAELAALATLWEDRGAQLIVVDGRRRAGRGGMAVGGGKVYSRVRWLNDEPPRWRWGGDDWNLERRR